MKVNNIFFLFFLFAYQINFSQSLNVKFKFTINKSNNLTTITKKFTLKQNNDFSIFEIDNIKDISQFKNKENTSIVKENDSIVFYIINDNMIETLHKEKYFKDFEKNTQISNNHLIQFKSKNIKEEIEMFKWDIVDSDTIIGKYNCKKARTHFRGRDYIAYYTNEIANHGGPWKFDGLPGFILYVKSIDNYISIEPTEITLELNKKIEIKNPFENKKNIVFEDLYKIYLEEEKKNFIRAKTRNPYLEKTKVGPLESIEIIEELQKERIYE